MNYWEDWIGVGICLTAMAAVVVVTVVIAIIEARRDD